MWKLKPSRDVQIISNGRVACPRLVYQDISVESCFGCPWLDTAEFEATPAWVRCGRGARGSRPLLDGELLNR